MPSIVELLGMDLKAQDSSTDSPYAMSMKSIGNRRVLPEGQRAF
jgi:hypothetical protein